MPKATATAKATLVIIATQAGPQPQIWYDDGGRTVGPPIKPVEKYPLPPGDGKWTIDAAIHHIAQEQRSEA